ncbi:MAG: hypothetical protein ACJASL_000145 [Paraglaciecola sp.]|jgi:hypothetical protein
MKSIIILAAITLTGCLHDKPFKESLYCDDVLIAVGDAGFAIQNNYYRYKVDGQIYRYIAIEGSVCKIVELN